MSNTIDRLAMLNQCDKWVRELVQDKNPERLHVKLVAVAHALQRVLSDFASRDVVPHASALEVLMRAIAHDIEGDPSMKTYVRQKLDIGYKQLLCELLETERTTERKSIDGMVTGIGREHGIDFKPF